MGKDLYYTIIQFFQKRMSEHDAVFRCRQLDIEGEYIFEIDRVKFPGRPKIWLADQYRFTDMDYDNRPEVLKAGDYILVAKPEAGFSVDPELIRASRIGVGKLGEFMGALRVSEMWKYVPPTDEEKKARKEKWESKKRQR
jgi:hypothetical protein